MGFPGQAQIADEDGWCRLSIRHLCEANGGTRTRIMALLRIWYYRAVAIEIINEPRPLLTDAELLYQWSITTHRPSGQRVPVPPPLYYGES